MKRIFLFLTVIMISGATFAQKTTEIQASKLPKATTKYIADNLPGSTITKAAKVEDQGVLTYNVTVDVKGKKHLFIFDKDGKFLKKGGELINSYAPKDKAGAKPAEKPAGDQKKAQ
jgi:hypothetical protein